jgi:hypothetical protein
MRNRRLYPSLGVMKRGRVEFGPLEIYEWDSMFSNYMSG